METIGDSEGERILLKLEEKKRLFLYNFLRKWQKSTIIKSFNRDEENLDLAIMLNGAMSTWKSQILSDKNVNFNVDGPQVVGNWIHQSAKIIKNS